MDRVLPRGYRKMIPRGKTLTFWQKSYTLAKPILRGTSLTLSYLKPGKLTEKQVLVMDALFKI